MFQYIKGDSGKIIWIWRILIWLDNDIYKNMKIGSISWYDKWRERQIFVFDFRFEFRKRQE